MVREIERNAMSGIGPLLLIIVAALLAVGAMVATEGRPAVVVPSVIVLIVGFVCLFGLFVVNPNEAKVLQLFGSYVGSVRNPGLRFANPFYSGKAVSLRVRNFESNKLKVNDHDGSPIEIAAVVVWRVVDSAEAAFEVDDYVNYVHVQSEAALRNLATQYPYDAHEEGKMSLRGNTQDIAEQLKSEVQQRLSKAGVEVVEARISHLAYAPEIAGAMLRRQQAGAIIAARQKIVEGAVGMVEMALQLLQARQVVELDSERKAQMVSNLLVVLCGEQEAHPVINTGTIHQ